MTDLDCSICENRRYVHSEPDEHGYVFASPCKCKARADTINRIKRSGLFEQLKTFRFDNFRTDNELQKTMLLSAKKFVERVDGSWFAAFGQSGSGKTHICTAVCGELMNKGLSVTYLRWAVELKRIKLNANSPEYEILMGDIFRHDVIYIDDFLKRRKDCLPTDADVKLAFEIIDTALALNKILIISGEDSFNSLMDVDVAIAGRIKQKTQGFFVEIKNDITKNYRLRKEN